MWTSLPVALESIYTHTDIGDIAQGRSGNLNPLDCNEKDMIDDVRDGNDGMECNWNATMTIVLL